MKAIALLMFSVALTAVGTAQGITKAEPLTPAQHKQLDEARQKVHDAEVALEKVKESIAQEHGFLQQDWMEWQAWWEIDGDYIVARYHNSMMGSISGDVHGSVPWSTGDMVVQYVGKDGNPINDDPSPPIGPTVGPPMWDYVRPNYGTCLPSGSPCSAEDLSIMTCPSGYLLRDVLSGGKWVYVCWRKPSAPVAPKK